MLDSCVLEHLHYTHRQHKPVTQTGSCQSVGQVIEPMPYKSLKKCGMNRLILSNSTELGPAPEIYRQKQKVGSARTNTCTPVGHAWPDHKSIRCPDGLRVTHWQPRAAKEKLCEMVGTVEPSTPQPAMQAMRGELPGM